MFLCNLLTWPPVQSQQELCNLQNAAAATSMDNGPLSCIRLKQPRLTFSAPLLIHVPCNFISCLSGNAQFLKRLQKKFVAKFQGTCNVCISLSLPVSYIMQVISPAAAASTVQLPACSLFFSISMLEC